MEAQTFTAKLDTFRQSPRKIRLVADAIRGKKVEDALVRLDFLTKRGADPLKKLLQSAVANAKNSGAATTGLFVKKISVDNGPILYRRRFRARGRVVPVRKRTSHVVLELGTKK